MAYRWEHFVSNFITSAALDGRESRHGVFVREFASVVTVFQDRCSALVHMHDEIMGVLEELAICPYNRGAFAALLDQVQKTVCRGLPPPQWLKSSADRSLEFGGLCKS